MPKRMDLRGFCCFGPSKTHPKPSYIRAFSWFGGLARPLLRASWGAPWRAPGDSPGTLLAPLLRLLLGVLLELSGRLLGHSSGKLPEEAKTAKTLVHSSFFKLFQGSKMHPLRVSLGAPWKALGMVVGGALGRSWDSSWSSPGAILETSWGLPGALLQPSWGLLGPPWKRASNGAPASTGAQLGRRTLCFTVYLASAPLLELHVRPDKHHSALLCFSVRWAQKGCIWPRSPFENCSQTKGFQGSRQQHHVKMLSTWTLRSG